MIKYSRPIFGRWTATVHCKCGKFSSLDMYSFRILRSLDVKFKIPLCACGQKLLNLKCLIPEKLWHNEEPISLGKK